MKQTDRKNTYYFVDESGDPCFYDKYGNFIVGKEGRSKLLMLGFVETEEPKHIRQELSRIRDKIKNDPGYGKIFATVTGIQSPSIWMEFFKVVNPRKLRESLSTSKIA